MLSVILAKHGSGQHTYVLFFVMPSQREVRVSLVFLYSKERVDSVKVSIFWIRTV